MVRRLQLALVRSSLLLWLSLSLSLACSEAKPLSSRASPSASEGCVSGTLDASVRQIGLDFGGVSRSYALHIPPTYDGKIPLPLLLDFHGLGSSAAAQRAFSGTSALADVKGFIVAYPDGWSHSWNAGACCGNSASQELDDVGFVRALLADLAQRGCIDRSRVYATGMSNGGFMSHRLACEAADLIAAIGPIAGVLGIAADECRPSRAVSVIHFHGSDDRVIPFAGGGPFGSRSVPETISGWVERNGCGPDQKVTREEHGMSCETWNDCRDGASVTLCTLAGAGHRWPASHSFSANEAMWNLFSSVRLGR